MMQYDMEERVGQISTKHKGRPCSLYRVEVTLSCYSKCASQHQHPLGACQKCRILILLRPIASKPELTRFLGHLYAPQLFRGIDVSDI